MLSMLSRQRSLFRRQSKNIPQCFISSVTNYKLPSNKDRLTVQWDDGFESQFAAVWLRDNCPHPKITHPTSFGRLMLMEDLDTDITIKEVKFSVSNTQNIGLIKIKLYKPKYQYDYLPPICIKLNLFVKNI